MKRITLEEASKNEIIQAIKCEFSLSSTQSRIEQTITHIRIKSLISEMERECKNMDRHRQKKTKFDPVASKRWLAAHARWNRANAKLREILA